jgi:tetratricopeptide (TPR) repeat protein
MSPLPLPLDFLHALDRYRFLTLLNAAHECEEYQFAKQASMLWLVNYPGDLYVQYHQALTKAHLNNQEQAISQLESLIEQDPLFVEPIQTLQDLASSEDQEKLYHALRQYLTEKQAPSNWPDDWLKPMWQARLSFTQGDYEEVIALVHQALVKDPPSPIPAVLHLKTAYKINNQEMLSNLSEIYYERWPKCLQINIIKALADMNVGKEAEGVERLHWAAAHDSAGQVIRRLLGSDHRFRELWLERMEIYFDLPIPASISAVLGWNQLQAGFAEEPELEEKQQEQPQKISDSTQEVNINKDQNEKEAIPTKSEKPGKDVTLEDINPKFAKNKWATEDDFEEIQKVFSRMAKKLNKTDLERSDNRFPVYVILTSKKQLETIYGPNTAAVIDDLLNQLVSLIRKLSDWNSLLFYPDDPAQMSQIGLKPTTATDPWDVKLSLTDLDEYLAKQGEMIGALLIVGGPDIIPFHHLPNPTTDNDLDVPSDNPYGTIDENYFLPQWPVGRLPGEKGTDAGLLLFQIRHLIYQYEKRSKSAKIGSLNITSILDWFRSLFSSLNGGLNKGQNLGYSAEIWKEASSGVYATVARAKDLHLSPPMNSGTLPLNNGTGHKLGYFNLHGVKDGPHWYGQKDFSSESIGPDYPIALSPEMFNEKVPSPKLVFTEACYGANVKDKQHDESISLKFMDSGTKSFIGSTCIAYGSVTLPLIAADYLANTFWQQVLKGQPAGYALMQAKLSLAEEMTRLQGFLDGEDQKTILSFVLYGDPLALHDGLKAMPKPLFRIKSRPSVRTLSDSDMESSSDANRMPNNVSHQVKEIVEKYLPGLHNAQMHINKSIDIDTSEKKKSRNTTRSSERYVVTLQKSFNPDQQIMHHHYARMTFDQKGKLIKFTSSR